MTPQATQLFTEALHLSEQDRGDLAAKLIDSLDTAKDDEIESAWSQEILERLAEIREGRVQPLSWPEARRLILEDGDDSANI